MVTKIFYATLQSRDFEMFKCLTVTPYLETPFLKWGGKIKAMVQMTGAYANFPK